MADVAISLDQLETMSSQLEEIIEEFESAATRSEELEAAIGHPFDRDELRLQAADFEERWDLQRDQLKEGLIEVREHVDGVIDGVEEWDTDTAISLDSKE